MFHSTTRGTRAHPVPDFLLGGAVGILMSRRQFESLEPGRTCG